jgi:hypothetical protein
MTILELSASPIDNIHCDSYTSCANAWNAIYQSLISKSILTVPEDSMSQSPAIQLLSRHHWSSLTLHTSMTNSTAHLRVSMSRGTYTRPLIAISTLNTRLLLYVTRVVAFFSAFPFSPTPLTLHRSYSILFRLPNSLTSFQSFSTCQLSK